MKHAVLGTIEVKPGTRDQALAHMKGASMAKVNQEAGHLLVSLTGIQSKLATELADGGDSARSATGAE